MDQPVRMVAVQYKVIFRLIYNGLGGGGDQIVGCHLFSAGLKMLREVFIICIQNGQVVPLAFGNRQVDGTGLAVVFLSEKPDAIRLLLAEGIKPSAGIIGRPVIYQHNFKVLKGLVNDRANGPLELLKRCIVGGHQYRNFRFARHNI